MSAELIRIAFYGDELQVVERDGKPWVLLKPMCEALGLNDVGQRQRIQRQAWATGRACVTHSVAEDGKNREMFALDLDVVPMWLATISTSRIADPAVRAKLERYQCEAADVLRRHFLGRDEPLSLRLATEFATEAMRGYRAMTGLFADMARRVDRVEERQTLLERGVRNGGRLAAMPSAYGPLRRKKKIDRQLELVKPPPKGGASR